MVGNDRYTLSLGFFLLSLGFPLACSDPQKPTLRSESGRTSSLPGSEDSKGNGGKGGSTDEGGSGNKNPGKDEEGSKSPGGDEAPNDTGSKTPDTGGMGAGLECTKSSNYQNVKFCETTVEGVAIKFVPLDGNVKPSRIAIYMHGDTARDWFEPFVVAPFVSWAKKRNILLVLSRSTTRYDDDGPNEWSYGAAQPEDARKLEKALGKIVEAYKAPSDNLLYFGTSGGPWFMSYSWIPMMGGKFPGLYALSCGGSQAWQKFAWDTKDSKLTAKIKIFYNFGDKDFLAENQENSLKHFNEAGIETTKKVHPGKQHCDHDIFNATVAFWEANMK